MATSKSPHVWREGPVVTEGRMGPMECSGEGLVVFLVKDWSVGTE